MRRKKNGKTRRLRRLAVVVTVAMAGMMIAATVALCVSAADVKMDMTLMEIPQSYRPAKLYASLKEECPLRADIVEQGFDLMMVRELTGGIYFGERGRREGKYGPKLTTPKPIP